MQTAASWKEKVPQVPVPLPLQPLVPYPQSHVIFSSFLLLLFFLFLFFFLAHVYFVLEMFYLPCRKTAQCHAKANKENHNL